MLHKLKKKVELIVKYVINVYSINKSLEKNPVKKGKPQIAKEPTKIKK